LLLILIILGNGFCEQRVCDNCVLATGRCGSRIGYVKVSHLESPDRRSPVRLEKTAHSPRRQQPVAQRPAQKTISKPFMISLYLGGGGRLGENVAVRGAI
jgi:hypothetical protein